MRTVAVLLALATAIACGDSGTPTTPSALGASTAAFEAAWKAFVQQKYLS